MQLLCPCFMWSASVCVFISASCEVRLLCLCFRWHAAGVFVYASCQVQSCLCFTFGEDEGRKQQQRKATDLVHRHAPLSSYRITKCHTSNGMLSAIEKNYLSPGQPYWHENHFKNLSSKKQIEFTLNIFQKTVSLQTKSVQANRLNRKTNKQTATTKIRGKVTWNWHSC